jgi:hypothetical protein
MRISKHLPARLSLALVAFSARRVGYEDSGFVRRAPSRHIHIVALTGSLAMGSLLVAARAEAADSTGTAADAQPGLRRVGVAERATPLAAGTIGYGYTEPQTDDDGAHHRLGLKLAGAAGIAWLNVAGAIDARYDLHQDDSGGMLEPSLAVRGFAPWRALRFGAELRAWVPGSEAAASFADALSLDTRLLFAGYAGKTLLAMHAGYRLDRSAGAGDSAPRLSASDRLALGLSSFDSVLLGLGADFHLDRTELFAEVSMDLLVGEGAPAALESPLRITGGVRREFTDHLSAELAVDVSLSQRPSLDPNAPLVPIEPRFSLLAGVRYGFAARKTAPKAAPAAPTAPPTTVAPAPLAPAATATLDLVVTDEEGAPIPAAKLRVAAGGAERELEADVRGQARIEKLPPGSVTLRLEANGFEPTEHQLSLEAGAPRELRLELKALRPPSQVRGTVRSFGGAGLSARVRVEPLGKEITTDAQGSFQLDVPPGHYEVVIEAQGFEPQRRKVSVDPEGVVILNADLVKRK